MCSLSMFEKHLRKVGTFLASLWTPKVSRPWQKELFPAWYPHPKVSRPFPCHGKVIVLFKARKISNVYYYMCHSHDASGDTRWWWHCGGAINHTYSGQGWCFMSFQISTIQSTTDELGATRWIGWWHEATPYTEPMKWWVRICEVVDVSVKHHRTWWWASCVLGAVT